MLREEIEEKLKKLKKELQKKEKKKKELETKMADIEDTVESIRTRITEIETNLAETVATVEKRLKNVYGAAKFKNAHMENVKKKVYSSDSAQSVDTLSSSISDAVTKYNEYDDLVETLKCEISNLEAEIADKEAQLKKTVI